jgi:hypothetical protein
MHGFRDSLSGVGEPMRSAGSAFVAIVSSGTDSGSNTSADAKADGDTAANGDTSRDSAASSSL